MFKSLTYPNFRLFFFSQFFSLCGSWMQQTAQAWLVYRLTRSSLLLGLVTFVGQFPIFLFGFYAGLLVDRLNHRRLVIATQVFAMVQAAVLAGLTLTGVVAVWHIFALAFALGVVSAFDIPARQVLVGELVAPADRHNAIALNSFIVNGSRIIGPAAAGAVIAWKGEGVCFAINAASYCSVLLGLLLMRDVAQARMTPHGPAWEEIGHGVGYALGHAEIRRVLGVLTVFSIAGLPIYVLLPVFAEDVLRSGAKGLGIISSFSGLGATIGALFLARRGGSAGLGKVMTSSCVLFGLALMGLSATSDFKLACLLFWLVGFAAILVLAAANTLLQELSSDRYRGRIMSFYSMLFIGLSPLGSFMVGGMAAVAGVAATVLLQAFFCMLAGLLNRRNAPGAGEAATAQRA